MIVRNKVLVLTPRFPYPLLGGDKLRIFKMCKALSQSYDLTLLSFIDEEHCHNLEHELLETGVFKEIHTIYKSKLSSYGSTLISLLKGEPLQVGYYYSRKFEKKINELVESHQIVLSHLIRTAQYSNKIVHSTKKVLEMTDAISMNYSRVQGFSLKKIIYKVERRRLLKFEKECVTRQDLTSFISSADVDYLVKNKAKINECLVVTNGVDIYPEIHSFSEEKREIVFIGNMHSEQNFDAALWFATNVMPILSTKNFSFKVIGKISSSKSAQLSSLPNVVVVGAVNSLFEATKSAFVGVCPMRIGAGVQNKVLEYMSLGLPCITSPLGYEGISAIPGRDLIIAEGVNEYVEAIESLTSKSFNRTIAVNGNEYVKLNHEWDAVMHSFVKKLDSMIGNKK
ncbi:hypothetical protein BS623_08730 [Vibrio parahaemolyticus]|uniref:Glycosyltransferase n=1 Tax=Vibrio parahaemolyticus TaxID=670 RepID=A0AAW3IQR2_VIBPH|nr:glycosyltransferase [Vibrio parahaemolyticus]EGQ9466139.1 glycosyltransferase [Vibrio parahaemolyticus]EGR1586965.1 glycosyltransferase [Vibrio parahaemolyticus]EHP3973661.1 glycosyltransferase [Vibrio parahaemolyticus]EHR1200362.1 glycosyltransferase [Vibrio parahaemolyticus]EHR5852933.1 glycosyltransferase [Vibrio parahaemolyticus]